MKKLLYIILILLISACEDMPMEGDYLYIRYKDADMPVWTRGNKQSGIYIIYLHGGPGGSSFIDIQNNFFSDIESRYAMVYYDQRASGNSIGKSDKSLLTIDQFTEDLDVIIEFVNSQYNPSKILLLGHSWGGTLGTAYLLTEGNQAKIDGWIEVDGGHNIGQTAYQYSRDYVLQYAEDKIANGSEKEKEDWGEIKDYYWDKESWRNTDVIIQHSKNVTKAEGYFFSGENREGLVGVDQVLFSETDYLALLAQNKTVISNMDVWYLDYTQRLHEINIPTLLLWGISDGILPVQLAYEARESMELDDDLFYIFQESGHSPHYEQTTLFNEKVIDFVENHIK